MRAKDLRAEAWENMKKANYWYLFLASIILTAISGLLSFTFIGVLLIGPFTVGLNYYYLKAAREGQTDIKEFFQPVTNNFMNGFILGILKWLYTFLWTLLFIIPGIIKGYSYSMAEYIMADNDKISGDDAITASRKLMDGHKLRLFLLHLSFIGWFILGILTFGIGLIFLAPYVKAAETAFYRDLIKDAGNANVLEVNDDDYDFIFD